MNHEPIVKATSRTIWIVFIAFSIVFILVGLFWKEESMSISHRIGLIAICVFSIFYCLPHAAYSAEMNSHEVCCSRFGKESRSIRWEQVEAIVIARDFRLPSGTSGNTRILVIPKGCPLSDIERVGAVLYILRFYKYVIWVDDSKKNREYIKCFWGELLDYRYR